MNPEIVNEIIEELSSTLSRIETQSAAILEFIKEKGLAKEDDLTPYLERAANTSSVRWRATRVRLTHLFSGLEKSERQAKEHAKSSGQEDNIQREEGRKEPATRQVKDAGREESQEQRSQKERGPRHKEATPQGVTEKGSEEKPSEQKKSSDREELHKEPPTREVKQSSSSESKPQGGKQPHDGADDAAPDTGGHKDRRSDHSNKRENAA